MKYYHTSDGTPVQPPPPRKRKKTISVCEYMAISNLAVLLPHEKCLCNEKQVTLISPFQI